MAEASNVPQTRPLPVAGISDDVARYDKRINSRSDWVLGTWVLLFCFVLPLTSAIVDNIFAANNDSFRMYSGFVLFVLEIALCAGVAIWHLVHRDSFGELRRVLSVAVPGVFAVWFLYGLAMATTPLY